jgi:non-ribosomal peptide synthetase-like protein
MSIVPFASLSNPSEQFENDKPLPLHWYFERQARLRPEHPAVEFEGEIHTYQDLDQLGNRIARCLRERRVGPGSLVGIYMTKSFHLYAVILGILKAGGGYVPIDSHWPTERIQAIAADARLDIIVGERALGQDISQDLKSSLLLVDDAETDLNAFSGAPLPLDETGVTPVDVCYVIYTSGSTGRPKGVVIEHRNSVNFVRALGSVYGLTGDDRIYQGFSVAFDASVEEIWSAFSLGGTLVVPNESVTKSPSDVANFITTNNITCFSTVPTFLSMIDGDLPTVRLLVLGGEACPQALVDRWAHGRRMMNTYGPTEATVVATVAECLPGRDVTIGKPLPGYTVHVLDENLLPVPQGERGELFIGGLSVARQYLGRLELTAQFFLEDKFQDPPDPNARLYRTHDLVRMNDTGMLEFIGRSDSVIKLRGYRIDLAEIETVLAQHPQVRQSVVAVFEKDGLEELAAYLVSRDISIHLDRSEFCAMLRRKLPDYMVPKYLEMLPELPTLTSGKVNRKGLPQPQTLLREEQRERVVATSVLEQSLVDVFEECLGISPIYVTDDFFHDLSGHSLRAARVATEVRMKLNLRVTVRDVYKFRTIQRLAEHLALTDVPDSPPLDPHGSSPPELPAPVLARWACAICQAVTLVIYYAVATAPIALLCMIVMDVVKGRIEWWFALSTITTAAFLVWPTWLIISIAVKWLIIGRYKPGRYRIWGVHYLRWWIANRFQSLGWAGMFVGTPLMSAYFRAMGAEVGHDCTISTPHCTAFDLVSIGPGTSIGAETQLLGYRLDDGWLTLGRVEIGANCFVGEQSNLGLNVVMERGARLDDMSLLPDDERIGSHEGRQGSPCTAAEARVPAPIVGSRVRKSHPLLFGLIHLALIYVMGYLLILSSLPSLALVGYVFSTKGLAWGIASVFPAVPLSGFTFLLIVLSMKRFVIGRIKPGIYPIESFVYLRIWFLNYLMTNMRSILLPIYATMVMPHVLRSLGAKIGSGVEISTVMHIIPDLVEIADNCFLADACLLSGMRLYGGCVEISTTKIGERTFVGNSSFIPAGTRLGSNCLIGVMSVPPANQSSTPDGTLWLGSPSFELFKTEKFDGFNESVTYRPRKRLVFLRALMETGRILLPGFIIAADLVAFVYLVAITYSAGLSIPEVLMLAGAYGFGLVFPTVAIVAYFKTILMGKFGPIVKPLWSPYVWANEVVNGIYESVAANAMSPLLGTSFISWCLRLMGCKVGRWACIDTTIFSEFDLVEIGDFVSLNLGVTAQTHLFEDRIMKSDTLKIGSHCSVGNMATLLYGTRMEEGSMLDPMSLLMKGETLQAWRRYRGIPCGPVNARPDAGVNH